MRILEHDLPRQYEKPQDLSVFSGDIEFSDPVTTLRGKLQYRGVLCECYLSIYLYMLLVYDSSCGISCAAPSDQNRNRLRHPPFVASVCFSLGMIHEYVCDIMGVQSASFP